MQNVGMVPDSLVHIQSSELCKHVCDHHNKQIYQPEIENNNAEDEEKVRYKEFCIDQGVY